MNKKILALSIVLMLLIVGFLAANAVKPGTDFNGPHFTLNLIGKKKEMPGEKDNPDRHTMFVPLDSTEMNFTINQNNSLPGNPDNMTGIKIVINQSKEEDGWTMWDGDATDGEGAFGLAAGKYNVYIAVKAKSPKYTEEEAYTDITGWVEAYDNLGQLWYYIDVGNVEVKKEKGNKNFWEDATGLFFVTTTEDDFGFLQGDEPGYDAQLGMWVFEYMNGLDTWYDDPYGEAPYDLSDLAYFWQFVNSGNKLIQVRFYPI